MLIRLSQTTTTGSMLSICISLGRARRLTCLSQLLAGLNARAGVTAERLLLMASGPVTATVKPPFINLAQVGNCCSVGIRSDS